MVYCRRIAIADPHNKYPRGKEHSISMHLEQIEPRLKEIEARKRELARYLWQVSRSTDRQDEARRIGIEMSSLEIEKKQLQKSAERQRRALAGYGDRI